VLLWVFGFAAVLMVQMPTTPTIDAISKMIPHVWANTAFLDLFVRGQGLADIVPSILALSGFTLAFFAIGLWRFKFE